MCDILLSRTNPPKNRGVISKKFYKEMHEVHYDITKMVAENYISKDSPKRKEVDNMFRVIEEPPVSLVKIRLAKELAEITAECVMSLSSFDYDKEDILQIFEMSIKQTRRIIKKG